MKYFNKMNNGFSLAEVLITLAIIGVVTAIVLPLTLDNYKKSVYSNQIKKSYSEMSSVFRNIIRESGGNDLIQADFCSGGNNVSGGNFLKQNYKVAKDCGVNTSDCFAPYNKYRSYRSKSNKRTSPIYGYAIQLANGAAISVYCYNNTNPNSPNASIYIDVNGKKGPNIVGRDFFRVYVYPEGVIDGYEVNFKNRTGGYLGGDVANIREKNFNWYCANPNDGDGCIDYLINNNWKMNY